MPLKKKLYFGKIGKKRAWILFLLPSFVGVSLFVLLPFADVIKRSFTTAITGNFVGFLNYKTIFETKAFLLAVKNTIRFTVVCIPLLITLGLFISLALTKLKNIKLLKAMLLYPLAIPAATVVLVWKMFFYQNGFLNAFLSVDTLPDYMNTSLAFWVLVFSYVWKNLGYTVILWLAGILQISKDMVEAAKIDGAGEWKCFFHILMPNLKGTLFTISVLSFLNSFKVFREAFLVAGSYPDKSMYLLQHLFNNWFMKLDLDKMAAAAVCVGIILFFAILMLQKLWDNA